jgi:hypothetical protein
MFENFGLIGEGEPMPGGGDAGYMQSIFGRSTVNIDALTAGMNLFPGDHSRDHAREIFYEDVSRIGDHAASRRWDSARF